jgi:hypothetical protein
VTRINLLASSKVAAFTSGPTDGAVPNAGGEPAGAGAPVPASGGAASARPATTAPATPSTLCVKNHLRDESDMGIASWAGDAAPALE